MSRRFPEPSVCSSNKVVRWMTTGMAVSHSCSRRMSRSLQVTGAPRRETQVSTSRLEQFRLKSYCDGPTVANCVCSMCNSFVTWTVAYLLRAQKSCPNHHSLESDRVAPSQDLCLVQTSRRENTNLFTQ